MTSFNLENRCENFAVEIRIFVKQINLPFHSNDDIKQLVRASGSIGANYIEANDSLGSKDFVFRLRIARKEAKESAYWLRILLRTTATSSQIESLIDEANQIKKILRAIIYKVSDKK